MSIAVILLLAVTLIAATAYGVIEYKNIQAAKKKRKPMATMKPKAMTAPIKRKK